jgi:hypothetical protein
MFCFCNNGHPMTLKRHDPYGEGVSCDLCEKSVDIA